jgi:hypothetical protein
MARTAPVPNIPAIPGMNPGLFVLGGGGDGGGSGAGGGKGGKKGQGADGKNGGKDAKGGGKSACGGGGKDGGGPSGGLFPAMRYEYDDGGNLAAAVDADGNATIYEYDAEHCLVAYRLPTVLRFHFRYDEAGRGVETWGELPDGDLCLDDGLPDTLADGRTRARGIHHVKIDYGPGGYSEVVDATCVFRYFGNEHGKVDKAVAGGKVFSRTYDARGHLISCGVSPSAVEFAGQS